MNERGLLLEMPVVSENEVFAQSPVASVSTENTLNLEGDKLRTFVMGIISKTPLPQNYELTDRELGTIISHHCTGKPLRKAALQTIPQVLISNNIISPWKRKEGKGVLSGLVAAPISINGEKYLCCVTLHKNLQKKVTPYAITLKDADGKIVNEEKVISAIKVPDSTDGNSTFGNTRLSTGTASLDANSPSGTKIPNKVNETKINKNMEKNTIKLNENQLRQIVAESVKKVLNEEMEEGIGDKVKSAIGNGLGQWQRGRYENWNPIQRGRDRLKAMGQGADKRLAIEALENLMKKYSWLGQYVQINWDAINQIKQQKGAYGYGA